MSNQSDSQRILTLLEGKRIQAGILYVDIVGSTTAVSGLDPNLVTTYYASFLKEMTRIVKDFRGYVLKFVGDAVVGFFPSPDGFVNEADHTALCGLVMIEVCKETLSPYRLARGLPAIACRVGADFGAVDVVKQGAAGAYVSVEFEQNVMNVAAKIQARAGPNQCFIGEQLFKLVHSSYRTDCTKAGDLQLQNYQYPYYHLNMILR
jgi:class 3 adenylate cyclase